MDRVSRSSEECYRSSRVLPRIFKEDAGTPGGFIETESMIGTPLSFL